MNSPSERELRRQAYLAVQRALRDKRLVRQPCEVCADPFSHAHHRWGYADPLRIVWLCARHHEEDHCRMREGQRFYGYDPRSWQYSEATGPAVVYQHLERLFGLLNEHERRSQLRKLAQLIDEPKATA